MSSAQVTILAQRVIHLAIERDMAIATAESCTGGLVAGALTSVPGSSAVVYGGYVTYANRAKQDMIDVPMHIIESYGAVSEETALAMAAGALEVSGAGIVVAITGIAGPGGGSAEKPVGMVHFACATEVSTRHVECRFGDIGRAEVREASVLQALEILIEELQGAQA